jgi:hypothetical protein
MDPFERLRYVARSAPSGSAAVASAAAPAFAALAREPGALLTAARRLLDFHPSCGALWWMCAQVLSADDPELAAGFSVAELEEDPTGRVAEHLISERRPAVVVALAAPGENLVPALAGAALRSIRVIGDGWETRRVIAELAGALSEWSEDSEEPQGPQPEVSGWSTYEAEEALRGADLVVMDVLAAGPAGVVVPPGGAALALHASRTHVSLWAVGGTGRVLPEAVFELLLSRLEPSAGELVATSLLTSYVGPGGAGDPRTALATPDCPVPVELLRRAR